MPAPVHYELFVRRQVTSDWTLDMATEDRDQAIASAESEFRDKGAIAVKVTKETFDEETREFRSSVILVKGDETQASKKKKSAPLEPLCVSPQDLYTVHARERIGRLLDTWLARNRATPFELLHRPDLVERLEASGVDLQHAVQKIAVPEAQARDVSVHELIRSFQTLIERTIERLMKDARRGVLPDLEKESFTAAANRLVGDPERSYLLGAGVAGAIAPAPTWSEKVARLLDLADAAPKGGAARALALNTIEQPLSEILGSGVALDDLLGADLDLGARLAGLTRLFANDAVEALVQREPSVAALVPDLSPPAQRLARWLLAAEFESVRRALARRVVHELNGPRRLRPGDAEGEIIVLRALARALTAASGILVPLDDVLAAFTARSRALVTGDFVEAYLGPDRSAVEEAQALIWLVENVIGAGNKREGCRWVAAVIASLKFEKEVRYGADTAAVRLGRMAALQRSIERAGLSEEDYKPVQLKLGDLGGLVEADAKLVANLSKAQAPAIQRLTLLLRLATGEGAPLGPAADRARNEALRLVRLDETRAELARSPDRMDQVRELIQAAGLAA